MSTSSRERATGRNTGHATGRGTGRANATSKTKRKAKRGDFGPLALFIVVVVVALGVIQLATTIFSYSQSVTELNGLKRQESQLVTKKANLENDISRWNDKAYVTAQARQRLGFVFPGEQSIHVEHPEAVTGIKSKDEAKTVSPDEDSRALPWYSELAYGFKKADEPLPSQRKDMTPTSSDTGESGTKSDDKAKTDRKKDAKKRDSKKKAKADKATARSKSRESKSAARS
ncbi:septum formation initiator family protein [Bifidobacterium sp. ESL0763]|uniref:FtsB family cell division protein n=1 Tax=Bifidobacterium sp. ESL0763 TaxID=2983227 RepID=UPI0023F8CB90|nr:septum formation initiator family protein [Bifidobacterium sp. ESL0763]MDF7663996.1 septum formation initiator family protein [Bifidobacterium sp. ESL0763]